MLGLFLDSEMEATCSTETSVDFQRTTQRHISENTTLHNHRFENLTSYMANFLDARLNFQP